MNNLMHVVKRTSVLKISTQPRATFWMLAMISLQNAQESVGHTRAQRITSQPTFDAQFAAFANHLFNKPTSIDEMMDQLFCDSTKPFSETVPAEMDNELFHKLSSDSVFVSDETMSFEVSVPIDKSDRVDDWYLLLLKCPH